MYKRLANKKRITDSVARMGGDEFAIVLEDVSDESNVQMIAEKMMAAMMQAKSIPGNRYFGYTDQISFGRSSSSFNLAADLRLGGRRFWHRLFLSELP